MNGRSYKVAFIAAAAVAVALAIALAIALFRPSAQPSMQSPQPATAQPPASGNAASQQPQAVQSSAPEPQLNAVQISPERLQRIGVKFGEVQFKRVNDEIRASGNVEINEQSIAYVQTRFAGWIQQVFANATYQYVRKGQPLFTIYSPEILSSEQEYVLAKQNRDALQGTSTGAASEADWLLTAAGQRLQQFQVPEREIQQLEATGKPNREITVDAPVSGYITERNALPNMYAQPETKLYAVAELSTVWVYAAVFQNDIGRLKVGDSATITVDAYPGREFAGRITDILPQIDAATRTARVRLALSNPSLVLKPGMFVNIRLAVSLGKQLTVPASGVLQSGTRQVAFVDHGNGYLEPRQIELSARVGDDFVVLKGLRAGERIVASANFLVDSESQLQAAIGSFAPPPPGVGAAAAMNAPAQSAINIELTTDPSPPHKGSNTARVRLTSQDGKPVSGAQVSVTFYMPAMPAMGMAAMRETAALSEKGTGYYEGALKLDSGGTWQVNVTVQQNGQTVATKQMNVSATGGM